MEEQAKSFPILKGMGISHQDEDILKMSKFSKFNLLQEDISLPAAVLYQTKVNHNLRWMQDFADYFGVKLSPHGKTTMCPYLFHQQIKTGAYAISLASASQVALAHSAGISRVLMVNQLVGKGNMQIISDILDTDPEFEFACLVDSINNVKQLGDFFRAKKQKLRVLLEIGVQNGRCGARGHVNQNDVIAELRNYNDCLLLIGLEFYEGILKSKDNVLDLIDQVASRAQDLVDCDAFQEFPIIISAAGSTWFDIVAERLSTITLKCNVTGKTVPLDIVLRPGSYLTHEIGTYSNAKDRVKNNTSLLKDMGATNEGMMTSLQVWAYVQSMPEPGLAIVALGKREIDASFDCEFPIPKLHFRPGVHETPKCVKDSWKINYVMDQHSFMEVEYEDDIQVGDMIAFEIKYPGTTLDKFRNVLLIDDDYNVLNVLHTYF